MAVRVLASRLPRELAEYIVSLRSCVQIQARVRGMLVRSVGEPRVGNGFARVGPWEYRFDGGDFGSSLESWSGSAWRPGVYK